jgi:uncharacterized protein with PIN domain
MYGVKCRRVEIYYKMVDPTSDLNENVAEEDAPECATCGTTLVDSPEHRVITWVEEGQVETAHFCDETCRMDWDGD